MKTITIDGIEGEWAPKEKEPEKDYEILSLYSDPNGIWLKRGNGKYSMYDNGLSLDENYLMEKGYKIHSIKRLSDGEVFTIGDSIENGNIKGLIITHFIVKNDSLYAHFDPSANHDFRISELRKIKVLFSTYDNVEIKDKIIEDLRIENLRLRKYLSEYDADYAKKHGIA